MTLWTTAWLLLWLWLWAKLPWNPVSVGPMILMISYPCFEKAFSVEKWINKPPINQTRLTPSRSPAYMCIWTDMLRVVREPNHMIPWQVYIITMVWCILGNESVVIFMKFSPLNLPVQMVINISSRLRWHFRFSDCFGSGQTRHYRIMWMPWSTNQSHLNYTCTIYVNTLKKR